MTDEPKTDDDGAVKPQVIDLEAEDVTVAAEKPAETGDAVLHPPEPKPRALARWILAALVIGLIGGGWLYRGVLSTYLPSDEMSAMKTRIDALEANGKTVSEQLLAVSQSSDNAARTAASLDEAVKGVTSGIADVQSRAGTFEERIATAEKALQSANADLAALRVSVSSGGTGPGTVDSAALAAIGQRIDALEKDVASFKSSGGGGENAAAAAALSQALSDLKAKMASGALFKDEYDRIARMVPAAAGLDMLAAHAGAGLPNAAGLAAELRAAVPALPKSETPAPTAGDGYWDAIWNALSGIITIRAIGELDWPALAEKCAALADSGDLPQAIALIDEAEGTRPSAISQWRDRASARLKLEAALAMTAQAVLRQIAALGGAQ